jgi:hypothetical protein
MHEKSVSNRQVTMQKVTAREPSKRYRNTPDDVKTELLYGVRDQSGRSLFTVLTISGIEMAPGAWRLLRGTWEPVVWM